MALVLNKYDLWDRREKEGYAIKSSAYKGNADSNTVVTEPDKILKDKIVKFERNYEESETHAKVWNRIEDLKKKINSGLAQFPSDYYTLYDLFRIDISKRSTQELDYTPLITSEIVNEAFTRTINLDEILEYTAYFQDLEGTGDTVRLIQQKSGATGSVTMEAKGVGAQRSLNDMLYNSNIFDLQRVNRAVARGYIGDRNNRSIGLLPAKTTAAGWDSSQQVPAATGTGLTSEELMYITMNNAIEKLTALKDFQTQQEIATPRLVVACHSTRVRAINRAINGQLNASRGRNSNRAALTEIAEIWPYNGDSFSWNKKRIVYPGIATDKAYILVPGSNADAPWWTLVKRGLTEEVGAGDVHAFTSEKRGWYFVQTDYSAEFFGSSDAAITTSGFGYVVEITLPA